MGLPPSSLEVGAVRGYPLLSHGFGSVGPGRAPGADSEVSLRVLEAQEIVPILVSRQEHPATVSSQAVPFWGESVAEAELTERPR